MVRLVMTAVLPVFMGLEMRRQLGSQPLVIEVFFGEKFFISTTWLLYSEAQQIGLSARRHIDIARTVNDAVADRVFGVLPHYVGCPRHRHPGQGHFIVSYP